MAHTHSMTDYPGQIVGIAAIAAGIGALTAVLFTPRSGTEVRSNLKQRTQNMKEAFSGSIKEAGDVGADAVKSVSDKAKETADSAKTTISRAQAKAEDIKEA